MPRGALHTEPTLVQIGTAGAGTGQRLDLVLTTEHPHKLLDLSRPCREYSALRSKHMSVDAGTLESLPYDDPAVALAWG